MKILFGFFLIILAVSLFLVNLALGLFNDLNTFILGDQNTTQVLSVLEGLTEQIDEGKQLSEVEDQIKNIATPEPLKIFQEEAQVDIATKRVFLATNVQRLQNGLPELTDSFVLDQIALAKVQDMFALQYFEHESPTGILFTDLAEQIGYEYIAMGENLALGLYESEKSLVQAWMDSPGHRANILSSKYSEIGLAAEKGLFEGQEVWLAVQTFGRPLSACVSPDETLKHRIETGKSEIEELQVLLNTAKEELDRTEPKYGSAYQKKIDAYNSLVDQYNVAVSWVRNSVSRFNRQVEAFNLCASSNSM